MIGPSFLALLLQFENGPYKIIKVTKNYYVIRYNYTMEVDTTLYTLYGTKSYFSTTIARKGYVTDEASRRQLQMDNILKNHGLHYHGLLMGVKTVSRRRHVIATILFGSEELKMCKECTAEKVINLPNGYQLPQAVKMNGESSAVLEFLGQSHTCLGPLLNQFKKPISE